jgi:hypothetical protein
MNFDRSQLFRFPWSQTDNPGGWIEVTDICNLACPGCFRKNNLEGHRQLDEIKKEIDFCKEKLNCTRICISGGEPLIYPDIMEVVKYIRALKLKPIILSNGLNLTADLLKKLKKAGLYQFYLHVDSGQNRPGWEYKTEAEMNELRKYYADLIYKTGKIKCGYNLTVRRSNLNQIQDIVSWYRKNISKVNHLSLITFRGIPKIDEYDVYVPQGKAKKERLFENIPAIDAIDEINISAIDIHDKLSEHFKDIYPAAYLNGTLISDTYKYLITLNVGVDGKIFGEVGAKTVEIYQLLFHLTKGKYDVVIPNPGKAIFFMAFFDKRLRKAFKNYLKYILANPVRVFYRTYIQALILQQPFEIIDGKANLCDGCINLMPYKGELINSCRLDEYRLLGGPITNFKEKSTIYSEK